MLQMQPRNGVEIRLELPPEEAYTELPLYTNLLRATIITLLVIFTIGNLTCLALFVLNGFGITSLSDAGLCALAAATIAEVAGLLIILFKKIA